MQYTIENFEAAKPDEVIAIGLAFDNQYGLHMQGTGKKLRWVAVKGYGDDWTMYCGWDYQSEQSILAEGDKVPKSMVKDVFDVDPALLQRYRI